MMTPSPKAWKMAGVLFFFCLGAASTVSSQNVITLVDFNGTNGASPQFISLVQGQDGDLYGLTTLGGTADSGTLFRVSSKGDLITLHNFCTGRCYDGGIPEAGLVLATDGNFYGTTSEGGTSECACGTIFRLSVEGKLTILHSFNFRDGGYPYGALVQAADGDLYGMASSGGVYQNGSIFKITLGGKLTPLYSFCGQPGCPDGARPLYPLIQGNDGNFYGGTTSGGANNGGTFFRMTPNGALTILHNFCSEANCSDGGSPGGIIQGTDWTFYGVADDGGDLTCNSPYGCGTVFRINRQGIFTVLRTFDSVDGNGPQAVTEATDGSLYGTTIHGGQENEGTIFKITQDGKFSSIHSFTGSDGFWPWGGFLLQATNGSFYGMNWGGGSDEGGTIFRLQNGLGPFVSFVRPAGKVGQTGGILGQGLTGTTSVTLNEIPANFTVVSDTFIKATVPQGATTGYVTVNTPTGVLKSNVPFHVIQ